jgi:uncharacterized protein (DUF1810 family)
MTDPFDLKRFLDAQEPVYSRVLAELRRGQKQSHGCGSSSRSLAALGHGAMAQQFVLRSRAKRPWPYP